MSQDTGSKVSGQGDITQRYIDHDIASLEDIIWSASSNVIQVETLDTYGVPDDDRLFNIWVQDLVPSIEDLRGYQAWFERVRAAVESGVQVDRVHIVPETLTPYLRFEMELAYHQFCLPYGESVYILQRPSNNELASAIYEDFYLLDEARLILPQYDSQNRFVGIKENLDPACIAAYVNKRSMLLNACEPFEKYFERVRKASMNIPKSEPFVVPLRKTS